ncbi:MAG: 4-diphosphocytidyl-2-C-methyl-D-erythritol kinase [Phycisphaerae bacterium]|nr:4-diphosphocytidyl-2-C-methyl-D-erythritol kinase [Phycisphaerae bacterium]
MADAVMSPCSGDTRIAVRTTPGEPGVCVAVRAPAKLNISLSVGLRRPDGYHSLRSLMVPLSLADELEISPGGRGVELSVQGPRAGQTPAGPENLVVRAGEALARRTGRAIGVRVRLTKRIPVGGGLAGGSADAAATLLGLNAAFELGLPLDELSAVAAELGSDVPFCLYGRPAWVEGRGELIAPFDGRLPELWAVLIFPPVSVSTAAVYAKLDALRAAGEPVDGPRTRVGGLELFNDLHKAALAVEPSLARVCEQVGQASGDPTVLVAGSGATLFALFDKKDHATEWERRIGARLKCSAMTTAVWCG